MRYFLSKNEYVLNHISSGRLVSNQSFLHQDRRIDTFVILICIKGILYIAQDNQKFLLTSGGYVVLYPDHHHYGYKESTGELSYFWCHFELSTKNFKLFTEYELDQYLFRSKSDKLSGQNISDYYILPEYGSLLSTSRTTLIFKQLLDFAHRESYSNRLANYALSLLAMEISQEYLDSYESDKNTSKARIRIAEVMEWIRIHYNMHLTVHSVAEQFFYNADYLSTTFKQLTGYSLLKYINHVKLTMAKKILLQTKEPIKAIAYKVGFEDEKYFMRLFKKEENMTPSEYRETFCKDHLVR